ncbi:hypothetical protein INT48_004595 [Thamnidium elegans]|uniref:Nonsense-mediated mRNA decay factor SMG8 n=1 Tax=Thamnidium elegans TaxID=101142 RepID=A0A8H7SWZ9_9FUNG|nr:hypothetical protein INT48_004595 [Thamnidium elegans]
MDEIKKLLDTSGLSSLRDSGLTIVSMYGVSEEQRRTSPSNTTVTLANRIADSKAFTLRNELAEGLQMYVDHTLKTVYIFMDSKLDINSLTTEKTISTSMMSHQSTCMRGLLFMLTVSHLVIPILPPTILPSSFMSTLVALSQVKSNMYTHLAQYQSSCWKYWDIAVPNALFERKELERTNPNLLGWWGPAKGVPMLVFIATNISFTTILPAAIKRMQDTLQLKTKNLFRALHLIPFKPEGNTPHPPVEVRSLFLLPSSSQPIIHIVPTPPPELTSPKSKSPFSFDTPTSISSYLKDLTVTEPASVTLYHEYSDKLLRNFVSNWVKAALTRHPLHHSNSGFRKDTRSCPLPTGIQFVSAAVPFLSFLFNQPITENGVDFKKVIAFNFPSTKGMIQQIEVILRKKIKDNIEIERIFSRTHSISLMEKCIEAYLQDAPPFYTEQYHQWKRNNVMHMYNSLARGPCLEEYAVRLERECDSIWKGGRQSCESVSLTGRACRLKMGHELESPHVKTSRDDRTIAVDNTKHNSGFTFFHACDCGRTQKLRDDPFDIEEANVKFYNKFNCCLGTERAALDIEKSCYGESQHLVLKYEEIPPTDASLIYLGPSSVYKNKFGLDKVEGFMNSTNFLIPWAITTVNELKLHQQEAANSIATATTATAAVETGAKISAESTIKNSFLRSSSVSRVNHDTSEWPVLGKTYTLKPSNNTVSTPVVASLEAFPVLGSKPQPSVTSAASPAKASHSASLIPTHTPVHTRQLFDTRRKRSNRTRERVYGLIRGYVGAEYECPHGHRFLSCGEGRVCKLGHASHPKEHGNYFVHQDLPIFVICPCTYANNPSGSNTEVTAQLLRLYVVTPEEALTISIEPKIKKPFISDLGITDSLAYGPGSMYVLRLPFIYRDSQGSPIPVETDIQKRLKSAILLKDCIKFHYHEIEFYSK